jgi:DNA-binding transcriptional ArsR family regulator
VDVFAALADPVRRSLLEDVASGPVRVVDLAAGRPISRPAVSKHLKVLVDAGLVTATERGRERHYVLAHAGLTPVSALVERLVLAGTPVTSQSLDALATEVRRTTRDRRTSPASRQETA